MREQPCRENVLSRIARSLPPGRPNGSGLWPARWQALGRPDGSIRATRLAPRRYRTRKAQRKADQALGGLKSGRRYDIAEVLQSGHPGQK
jgi:hypothetical protein